jgi:hypothetical protein
MASICKAESRGQESAARFWALSGPSIKVVPRRRPKVCKRLHLKDSPFQYFYCIECCGRCGAGESSLCEFQKFHIFSIANSWLFVIFIHCLSVCYMANGGLSVLHTLQSCKTTAPAEAIFYQGLSVIVAQKPIERTAQDYRRPLPPRVLYHRLYHLLPHYFSLAGTRNKF